jgi:hypothetical protein
VAAELRSVGAALDVREAAAEPSPIAVAAPPRRRSGLWILLVLAAIGVIAALAFNLW